MGHSNELIYVHDPMCSWCWGFGPALQRLCSQLPDNVRLRRLIGGLAADSDQPMPLEMQQHLQHTWRLIQQRIPGTQFNFAFWSDCAPRRSTYPACRAVLAARALDPGLEQAMIDSIQQAYYLRAMNPSDNATLVRLAVEIGLNQAAFAQSLTSQAIDELLQAEIAEARELGVNSFPTLVLCTGDNRCRQVALDYTDATAMLDSIETLID